MGSRGVKGKQPRESSAMGPRKFFFSREDGGFRNKEFQTTVIYIYIYICMYVCMYVYYIDKLDRLDG